MNNFEEKKRKYLNSAGVVFDNDDADNINWILHYDASNTALSIPSQFELLIVCEPQTQIPADNNYFIAKLSGTELTAPSFEVTFLTDGKLSISFSDVDNTRTFTLTRNNNNQKVIINLWVNPETKLGFVGLYNQTGLLESLDLDLTALSSVPFNTTGLLTLAGQDLSLAKKFEGYFTEIHCYFSLLSTGERFLNIEQLVYKWFYSYISQNDYIRLNAQDTNTLYFILGDEDVTTWYNTAPGGLSYSPHATAGDEPLLLRKQINGAINSIKTSKAPEDAYFKGTMLKPTQIKDITILFVLKTAPTGAQIIFNADVPIPPYIFLITHDADGGVTTMHVGDGVSTESFSITDNEKDYKVLAFTYDENGLARGYLNGNLIGEKILTKDTAILLDYLVGYNSNIEYSAMIFVSKAYSVEEMSFINKYFYYNYLFDSTNNFTSFWFDASDVDSIKVTPPTQDIYHCEDLGIYGNNADQPIAVWKPLYVKDAETEKYSINFKASDNQRLALVSSNSLKYNNPGYVSRLKDKTIHKQDAFQGVLDNQVLLSSNAINGLKALKFESSPTIRYLEGKFKQLFDTEKFTIFIARKIYDSTANSTTFTSNTPEAYKFLDFSTWHGVNNYIYAGNGTLYSQLAAAHHSSNEHIICVKKDGFNVDIFINGKLSASASNFSQSALLIDFLLGKRGSEGITGGTLYLGELAITSKVLEDSVIKSTFETWINKWLSTLKNDSFWLDSNDPLSLEISDTDKLDIWHSKSGVNTIMTAPTAIERPVIVTNSYGREIARFNSTDKSRMEGQLLAPFNTNEFTGLIAAKIEPIGETSTIFAGGLDASTWHFSVAHWEQLGQMRVYFNGAFYHFDYVPGSFDIFIFTRYRDGSFKFWLNNIEVLYKDSTASNADLVNYITLGHRPDSAPPYDSCNADIGEVKLWPYSISSTIATGLYTKAFTYWLLQNNAPFLMESNAGYLKLEQGGGVLYTEETAEMHSYIAQEDLFPITTEDNNLILTA